MLVEPGNVKKPMKPVVDKLNYCRVEEEIPPDGLEAKQGHSLEDSKIVDDQR